MNHKIYNWICDLRSCGLADVILTIGAAFMLFSIGCAFLAVTIFQIIKHL